MHCWVQQWAATAGIPTVVTPGVYTKDQRFDEALMITTDLGAVINEILNVSPDLLRGVAQ